MFCDSSDSSDFEANASCVISALQLVSEVL